ncbi:aspartate/glutamate racemase family protein [Williamsia sp. CHRR-6]|uniref:aspartate/glutamate racemase family protein n=1 Tax=Williamsia sp. CHRR-6 TaxID=2835871 RepID=UPI001BD93CF9|nr:aspartate/glutamate racemase family protein [Williamsia sp. CHRR-6]MBT0565770.1 Asp/Glu racemase [Williamsia sp. CHRR-6]
MRICLINPNTTSAMTDVMAEVARAAAMPDTDLVALTSTMGPASIESHYDEALSVPGVLAAIVADRACDHPSDGYLIACFGDPGLDAAREVAQAPVLGIAQASMHLAALIGGRFSVVTTLTRTIGRADELTHRYGVAGLCAGLHACEIPVLELETNPHTEQILTEACRQALHQDRSESIVLGCGGMADLAHRISEAIGAPVIDGVAAGVRLLQALIPIGGSPGKAGIEFAPPPAKPYTGLLSGFGEPTAR